MTPCAAFIVETPDAARQLANPVADQSELDQNTLVGECLDGVEVGLGDRCVNLVGAYKLPRSLKVEVRPTLARCSVVNPPVETSMAPRGTTGQL